jgi:hypothetical protein
LAILGAVTLVLLIARVNVANLLLARGAQRRGRFLNSGDVANAASRLSAPGTTARSSKENFQARGNPYIEIRRKLYGRFCKYFIFNCFSF